MVKTNGDSYEGGVRPAPKGSKKSQKTRQIILDAAIRAMAKWGYQGATLSVIANEAGLSQGPRQYYFPTKIDLMIAVRREIFDRASHAIEELKLYEKEAKTALALFLDEEIKRSKSDEYIVDLELKIAIRGDDELKTHLAPLIKASEILIDKWWVELFASTGLSNEELLAARFVSTCLLRGLAIERISCNDELAIGLMERQLIDTVYGLIFRS